MTNRVNYINSKRICIIDTHPLFQRLLVILAYTFHCDCKQNVQYKKKLYFFIRKHKNDAQSRLSKLKSKFPNISFKIIKSIEIKKKKKKNTEMYQKLKTKQNKKQLTINCSIDDECIHQRIFTWYDVIVCHLSQLNFQPTPGLNRLYGIYTKTKEIEKHRKIQVHNHLRCFSKLLPPPFTPSVWLYWYSHCSWG